MKCTDIFFFPHHPFPSHPQVVGGLDIHKKMVVDVWRDETGPSLNTLFFTSPFLRISSRCSANSLFLSLFLSLSLFFCLSFNGSISLNDVSVLPEPCDACHPKCYRAWDSSVHILGYLRTVRETMSPSITERFSVVEKEERRVCVCVFVWMYVSMCVCSLFFFLKGGIFLYLFWSCLF